MLQTHRVDMTPGGVPLVLHISQYDNTMREYKFIPYNEQGDIAQISGCAVTLEATKPDKMAVVHPCTYNADGSVSYTLGDQLAVVAGEVWSKLTFRATVGGGILGTAAIVWVVDSAGIKDDAVISQSDIPDVERIVELAAIADELADQVTEDANRASAAADSAEDEAETATSAKTAAQAAADDAAASAQAAAASAASITTDAEDVEAWAAGTRGGTPVPSTDPAYHNNGAYYLQATQAAAGAITGEAEDAEAWAAGTRNGVPVPSTDPAYENNAKYYSDEAGRVVDVAPRVTALEGRMTTAEGDIDTLESSVTSLTGRMTAAENYIGSVELALDSTQEMLTVVEPNATAANAHAVGETFIFHDAFYKTTAAIAVGDTITPGTNCTVTTLAQSFADGCSTIANAITAQGVTTPADASPAEIATNIGSLADLKYSQGETINYHYFVVNTVPTQNALTGTVVVPGTYLIIAGLAGSHSGSGSGGTAVVSTSSAEASVQVVSGVIGGTQKFMNGGMGASTDPDHPGFMSIGVYKFDAPTASGSNPIPYTITLYKNSVQTALYMIGVVRLGLPATPWS